MTAWATIVKSNAKYKCQKCDSTELIQAHDPTHRHIDPKDGICLCAEHHSQEHPDIPKALFFCRINQPYWNNISASSLAKEVGVHPRTIIRNANKLHIPKGILTKKHKKLILQSISPYQPSNEDCTKRSVRFPISLLERIQILAHKRHWSVNKWVIITCERESKPKNQS